MTFRERYLESLLFGKPDRIPLMPGGPRESTLRAWHQQGLPEDADHYDTMLQTLGLPPSEINIAHPGVNFAMIPTFEEKVLEHINGHYIIQDWMGNITEISDQFDYTYIRSAKDFVTRKWHKFPVETRDDFERMKERYQPDAPERFPENFAERCASIKKNDSLVFMTVTGPFWQLREWCGFEPLCMMFIEEPDFVQEMINFWRDFVLSVMQKMHRHITPDHIIINEDMAYKAHSMISPAMTRKFIIPVYKEWVAELKSAGCQCPCVDSDGYIGELIPIWIEAGMNVCTPIEVAAHNDIVAYREQFRKKMAYTGGIDKRAISKSGKALEDEIARVIPPLLKEGGFIPGCDHGIPSDISWQNYLDYCRLLAHHCGYI
ncbi:uroporphyrinogen decarboxylase family protein [uncultured Desulfobulbus sp.]|uniref:uroporphyrinogen decarboxylase family protein n=1 Tax=uncultured Desulfobulbus sp. TaxID=239745 RepID=UPI0029C8E596|nr:uroporphyrinogen decarboxylase family protein [uncultured Desulfobulbus sp.]